MFYGARYYTPEMRRFDGAVAQPPSLADTIVPGAANPLAYNRYAYSYNDPLNYTDPSGHAPACIENCVGYDSVTELTQEDALTQALINYYDWSLSLYGAEVEGDRWFRNLDDALSMRKELLESVKLVANALYEADDEAQSITEAFKNAYEDGIVFRFEGYGQLNCQGHDAYGCAGDGLVRFTSGYAHGNVSLFIHEMGHVYASQQNLNTENKQGIEDFPPLWGVIQAGEIRGGIDLPDAPRPVNASDDPNELFADVFMYWVLSTSSQQDQQWWRFMDRVVRGGCTANCWQNTQKQR